MDNTSWITNKFSEISQSQRFGKLIKFSIQVGAMHFPGKLGSLHF